MRVLTVLAVLFSLAVSGFSETIHIPGDLPTIQAGIDAAIVGDIVLVAPGTYTENLDFLGKAITLRSSVGSASTIINGGMPSDPQKGSVVTFSMGEERDSVLEGFTLYKGTGTYDEYDWFANGGGVYCVDSSPTLIDIVFSNNSVSWDGGGFYCLSGNPRLSRCTFLHNRALAYYSYGDGGGGMYNRSGNPELTDCTFIENHSEWEGGGFHNAGGHPLIIDCRFDGNSAISGGGLHTQDSPITMEGCLFADNTGFNGGAIDHDDGDPIFTDCLFIHNTGDSGGGIYNWGGPLTIKNCRFIENTSSFSGGAIALWEGRLNASNCLFIENEAPQGGGLYNRSYATMTNCTLCNNTAGVNGGGLYNIEASRSRLINCILWGDTPEEIFNHEFAYCLVSYSCIQGGFPGEGNIDADPLFVAERNRDYHLTYHSPCRDAGIYKDGVEFYDFEGDPRRAWTGMVDMGADEFYTHFYYTGDATPGGDIQGKLVGIPGTWPVGLIFGSGILEEPIQHSWGDFWLVEPLLIVPLIPIPTDGVLIMPATLPLDPPAPWDIPIQGLVGLDSDSLTNLRVLEVR
ncbi:MAG: right-handed parallel beta-helix repeat-containing protein [Planctomycetes bacterium]|nr:right-handed parallel beta-helix repeat-containing protein [Planctomycetota bacterium]